MHPSITQAAEVIPPRSVTRVTPGTSTASADISGFTDDGDGPCFITLVSVGGTTYVKFGTSGVTAAVTDWPLADGAPQSFRIEPGDTHFAHIVSSAGPELHYYKSSKSKRGT